MPQRPVSDKTSVAEEVRRYIDARPVIQEALAQGLLNHSALARKILDETSIRGEEAILVACRRHQRRLQPRHTDETIRRVLSGSKLEVRTRVGVITARPHWQVFARLEPVVRAAGARNHPIHVIRGSEALTIITDEGILKETSEAIGSENVLKTRTGLVELNLRSPEVVEDVQGFLSFVARTLSAQDINMVDVISCHKDNMFLVHDADLYKAMTTLDALIRQ